MNRQIISRRILSFLLLITLCISMITVAEASYGIGVTTSKVVLREKSSASSDALTSIPTNTKIIILSKTSKWVKTAYEGETGFVMREYVTLKDGDIDASMILAAIGSAPGAMAPGDKSSDVRKLQTALIYLGYSIGSIDGSYGSKTTNAVKAYQEQHGLYVDGIAGKQTVSSIFGKCSSKSLSKATTTSSSTSSSSTKTYKTRVLDWFEDNVSSLIPKGSVFTVKDVKTGNKFKCKRWSGTNHLDAEPLTASDTAIMKKTYGGKWSWTRRPILILYNGRVYAASMNGMPHGTTTIDNNNFDGHFCIHFKNSKTHETKKVDSAHQACVTAASKATW